MRRRSIPTLLLAASILVMGCDRGFMIDDSSGIPIVENFSPKWGDQARWDIADDADLTIAQWSEPDIDEYSADRYHLSDAKRLPDGRLAVANGYTGEIGFFDRLGESLGRVGGRGLEPGAFQTLRALHVLEESIWAFDQMGRWNVFDLDGRLEGTMYLEPKRGGWSLVEPFADELATISFAGCCVPSVETGVYRPSTPILRFERTGAALGTLKSTPGMEYYVRRFENGGSVTRSRYARMPVLHGGRDLLYVGSGDLMEIDVFASGEEHVRRISVPDWDLSISAEERAAEAADLTRVFARSADVTRRLGSAVSTQEGSLAARLAEARTEADLAAEVEAALPVTKPAYARFLEDATGHLWVADFDFRTARRSLQTSERWTVFNPDGRWLGSVITPTDLALTEIGIDYVLGIAQVDGRSVVQRHRLTR